MISGTDSAGKKLEFNKCIPDATCCTEAQCGANEECAGPGLQCRCKAGE